MTDTRFARRPSSSNPSVLLLGGSAQNSDFVGETRRHNLNLIVVDRNPNCALALTADHFVNADCRDTETILNELGFWRETIFAVLTFSELTESVAQLCQDLDLPGASKATAELFQSKVEAKKVFVAEGVPTPPAFLDKQIDWETLSPKSPSIKFDATERWILKPTSESGGRGISFHPNLPACLRMWASKERPDQWLAEQVIDGIHIDGNAFITSNGEFVRLGLSQRTFAGSGAREETVEIPPSISTQVADEVYLATEKGARAAGVTFGPVKVDAVVSDQGVFVLEMATRLHGPKVSVTAFPHVYRNYSDVVFSLYWEGVRKLLPVDSSDACFSGEELDWSGETFLAVALSKPGGRVKSISRKIPFLNAPQLPRVLLYIEEGDIVEQDELREIAIGFVYGAFIDRDFGFDRVRRIKALVERGIVMGDPVDSPE